MNPRIENISVMPDNSIYWSEVSSSDSGSGADSLVRKCIMFGDDLSGVPDQVRAVAIESWS